MRIILYFGRQPSVQTIKVQNFLSPAARNHSKSIKSFIFV